LRLLFGIHTSLELALAIKLSVATVVSFSADRKCVHIVRMHFPTKLGQFILLVFGLIFIFIDAGFFFNEIANAPFPSTLLRPLSRKVMVSADSYKIKSGMTE
jgi:hypothetical protein